MTWTSWPETQPAARPSVSENLLIYGDNLPALERLAETHAGAVQSIYLDPPYNTGTTFEHYVDDLSHARWLAMMDARLRALKPLLAPTGFIAVQIDDREQAALQLLMDEIFGRARRVSTIVVKMSELSGVKMSHVQHRLPKLKEYILLYAASEASTLRPIRVPKTGQQLDRYLRYYTKVIENPDAPVDSWVITPIRQHLRTQGLADDEASIRAFQLRESARVVYRTNNAALADLHFPTETAEVITATGTRYIWWQGKQLLFLKDHTESYVGDLWTDISTINLNKEGGKAFRYSKKPEALLERILRLTSAPGDLVLDPFAGSGTTGAVAEGMDRRWVMLEQGRHLETHILPRVREAGAVFRVVRVE